MILSDHEIIKLAKEQDMIAPLEQRQIKEVDGHKVVSYGVSSYGYDIRITNEFQFLAQPNLSILDPKDDKHAGLWSEIESGAAIIPPGGFVLARSLEKIKVPRDVLVVCLGKSTYARLGLIVNVTPLEPEWEGHITMELSNTSNSNIRVYANEGIAQLLFFKASEVCKTSYADKKGKYQGQEKITNAKV